MSEPEQPRRDVDVAGAIRAIRRLDDGGTGSGNALAMDGECAPHPALLWTEGVRCLTAFASLGWTWPTLLNAPASDGHAVMVLPGLGTSDTATTPLRRYLRLLGYRTYGWGLGLNKGPTARVVTGIPARLRQIADRNGSTVSLVGWSLGGMYARDVARAEPELVRQVIALGSPFGLRQHGNTHARWYFDRHKGAHVKSYDQPVERKLEPIPVPMTAIYSRLDGIAPWTACVVVPSATAENIEVQSSHLGLPHHPAVLYAVADRLAQRPGHWAPFEAPVGLRWAYPG